MTATRRLLSVSLAGALALTLAACGPEPAGGSGSSGDRARGTHDAKADARADAKADPQGKAAGASDAEAGAGDTGGADAGAGSKGGAGSDDGEERWTGGVPDEALEKTSELPASFPAASFAIPDGGVIDDAGERSATSWFVVLRAKDAAGASALWDAVVAGSGFTVTDAAETPEGGTSAVLTNAALSVTALTVPDADGSVLLSYDIDLA